MEITVKSILSYLWEPLHVQCRSIPRVGLITAWDHIRPHRGKSDHIRVS